MERARISELLDPFLGPPDRRRLRASDLDQISTYIDLLLRWNARINLTAIRNPEEIVPRHFGESLFLARHIFPQAAGSALPSAVISDEDSPATGHRPLTTVVDLGSGAGFPGIPVKIWAPAVKLVLVESNHRKVAFLREVARALTLTNVDVIPERLESLAAPHLPQLPPADIVTLRAIEKPGQVLPTAAKLLSQNGRLALLTTEPEFKSFQSTPTLCWQTVSVPESQKRILAIGSRK